MQKKHVIIIISLLTLCAVLSVAWAVQAEGERRAGALALEDVYQGALLSGLSQLERVRSGIDKALVTQDAAQLTRLLGQLAGDAAAAQASLSALPLSQAAMGDAVKLCGQVGDFAQTLLARPESELTAEDAATLEAMRRACDSLLSALREASGKMRAGGITLTASNVYLADADGVNRPLERAAEGIDYPTLIYDGPFSDAVSEGAPRGLGEGEIDANEAVRVALAFSGAERAAVIQESGGSIPAYVVQAGRADGTLTLAVTRQGGKVLWMFPESGGFETKYGLEDCKRAAQAFFAAQGYGEMRLTFWQMYGGTATLSYAAVQDGALLYPDLVKVQLRLDTLAVVGWEARHYLTSHTERAGLSPALSREEAESRVSPRLQIKSAQLCLIPVNRGEALCWEFTADYGGQTYYVYIDAQTGRQRDIQRLVVTDSGPKAE
ncbi:MAG: germination protein YpeB [Clostridia bacterium]|nr:germination protein YpeB [Clostridia bacterium]